VSTDTPSPQEYALRDFRFMQLEHWHGSGLFAASRDAATITGRSPLVDGGTTMAPNSGIDDHL
jgi:hypothetical protein